GFQAVCETVQSLLRHPHQAAIGANPEIAIGVLNQVTDAVAEQTLLGCIAGPFALVIAAQAAAWGANPQHSIRIDVERGDIFAGQSVLLVESSELSLTETIQTSAGCSDPEIALSILGDSAHIIGS